MLQTKIENKTGCISKQYNYVDFDPFKKQHRTAFVEFKLSGKWPANTRFILDPMYTNVPSMINQKLLDFYFNRDRAIPEDLKKKYLTTKNIYPIGSMLTDEEMNDKACI